MAKIGPTCWPKKTGWKVVNAGIPGDTAARGKGRIQALLDEHRPVLVAGKPSHSPIYAALADEEKVSLVPDVFSDTLSRLELCADRIHPNALGYQHMAKGVYTRLQELGLVIL